MRITSKGRVTIPAAIRRRLGLLENTEVEVDVVDDSVRVRKARNRTRGKAIVTHMRGRATSRLSTDEILALTRGKRQRQPRR
jgi:AbrB family looped-hinge helix DNA binding protein